MLDLMTIPAKVDPPVITDIKQDEYNPFQIIRNLIESARRLR